MARSSQEQQQIAAAIAARDNMALYQIYQRYAHDPALLQRQLSAYLAKSHDSEVARMTDASHLVYHFASKITTWFCVIISVCTGLKGKGFPYSLSIIGPGADPGVQAVSPQVTTSHPPGGRLPLHSIRPMVTLCRQQTSLRRLCEIACSSICLLKVSPVNARLTSPSYIHQYSFLFFDDIHPCQSNANNKVIFALIVHTQH